jgi:hypothetical protein
MFEPTMLFLNTLLPAGYIKEPRIMVEIVQYHKQSHRCINVLQVCTPT